MSNQNFTVNAAPNESRIRGRIVKIVNDPKLEVKVLQVKVEESFDVAGMANFTRSRVGKMIKICTPIDDKKELKENEDIEFSVSYQGDEGGGVFFVVDDRQ